MKVRAFNQNVSVIALKKNDILYGMTCAWTTQLDYDKIGCLMGKQSVTAKALCIGDCVGVSVLSKSQLDTAIALGDNHSDEINKFEGINYSQNNNAILINDSRKEMIGKVIDIVHLKGMESDYFVTIQILDFKENEKIDFLTMEDIR